MAAGGVLLPSAVLAQAPPSGGLEWSLRPALPEQQAEAVPVCGPQAALFASGGLKVWVTRKGMLRWRNPLRPLTPETLIVLQVSVNGRIAAAYGPDFDHLRQGSATRELEEGGSEPIRWQQGLDDLPGEIRVVAEDGTVLLGPMRFQACGDAPRSAAPRAARAMRPVDEVPPTGAAPTAGPSRPGARPGLPIPQGAIP